MVTNSHIHTPYSFCSYESISEIVSCADNEEVVVLGINDTNTFDGFNEFHKACGAHGIYPVFNIEFLIRYEADKGRGPYHGETAASGIRHFQGKGIRYPVKLPDDVRNLIASIWKGTQDHIWKMIDSLNMLLKRHSIPVALDYNTIRSSLARTSLLEQHLAQALYNKLTGISRNEDELFTLLNRLFNNPFFTDSTLQAPAIQQAIRNRFNDSGQPEYIPLPPHAVMNFQQAKQVILQAGGIPCYHCTFDESEKEPLNLASQLENRGIHAIEFIPSHISVDKLLPYMELFNKRDFCVLVGTDNDTPLRSSFVPATSDGVPLGGRLLDISYRGACIVAAHQELHLQKRRGFLDEKGKRAVDPDQLETFIAIGDRTIRKASRKIRHPA